MDRKELAIRNMLARIFEPYSPTHWEAADIDGRERINEAVKRLRRLGVLTAYHEQKAGAAK